MLTRIWQRSLWPSAWLAIALTTQGCTTFAPRPTDEVSFKERAETQVQGGLSVTVAVPTIKEAKAIYGVDLARRGIQPVWIEIKNEEPITYWFLPSGLDPEYFSPAEVTYAFGSSTSGDVNRAMDEHFERLQFRNPIRPNSTVSGFVLVQLDEGFKAVDVDLIARGVAKSFTYIILDPDFKASARRVDFEALRASKEIKDLQEEEELRQVLEQLPCCTKNKKGTEEGDPLNLVLIGDKVDIWPAFIRRGWHGTELIWSASLWRTLKSFLRGSRYRYSPVSPLYVYERPQDAAAQKARGTIHERNHLRLWLTPLRFRGKEVWLGQISRDIGVKFTLKSPTISTHVIDPDVDEARTYLIEDLAYSQALAQFGFVKGVGEASKDAPRMNLVGDPYYTDGLRVVMFFEPRPRTLADLEFIQSWEVPTRGRTRDGKGVFETPE